MNKILIVDDSDTQLALLTGMLESINNKIIRLSSAHSIVDIVADIKPNVILLDIIMPHKSGIDAYEELQQDARTKTIPIVFVTSDESLAAQCIKLNNIKDTYISKPVMKESLEAIVSAKLLRKRLADTVDALLSQVKTLSLAVVD